LYGVGEYHLQSTVFTANTVPTILTQSNLNVGSMTGVQRRTAIAVQDGDVNGRIVHITTRINDVLADAVLGESGIPTWVEIRVYP
jgi:hypothetical protein